MNKEDIVEAIEAEIQRLQQAKELLSGTEDGPVSSPKKRRGTMSSEGRARVAAAQKKRWAKAKRSGK